MNLIFTNKAFLWPTHRPDSHLSGWLEYQEEVFKQKLWPLHRLDKETTGCLLLAKDQETAGKAEHLFRENKVKKIYYFITQEKSLHTKLSCSQAIETKPAQTDFQFIRQVGDYALWQAIPHHGRTHQIRIHAKAVGIPLLGDSLYNPSPLYPHFFLHAKSIEIEGKTYETELPFVMQNLEVFANAKIAQILQFITRRETHYELHTNAYCLLHKEVAGLRVEKLNEQIIYEIYDAKAISENEIQELHKYIEAYFKQSFTYIMQWMENRGSDPNMLKLRFSDNAQSEWTIKENDHLFLLKAEQGKSFGLFLDQREQRQKISVCSKGKSILNLFCYTGGFSVYAAKAGAKEIVNVDTSKKTLDWVKENFRLNHLDPENYEYWATDARIFLKGCINKQRKFDIIVCDPPSFARSKDKAFKIANDFDTLMQQCKQILNPGGILYFSTNFEGWSMEDLKDKAESIFGKNIKMSRSAYDFEAPNQKSIMKGFYFECSASTRV